MFMGGCGRRHQMVYACGMQGHDSTETPESAARWWTLDRREKRQNLDLAILCFSVVMTFAAFVFNMGWIRFIFLFTAMPIILMGLHIAVGWAIYLEKCRAKLFYAACVFHPLSYILLYDSSDRGPAYMFFGQVPVEGDTEDLAQLLVFFAMLSFAASFGALLTLIVRMWLSKRNAVKAGHMKTP